MITPMLATATSRLPDGPGWAFQPKVDGYRCLAVITGGRVRLQSRSGGDMTGWFPGLANLVELGDDLVLDGEVAGCNPDGSARFELLAGWRGGRGTGRICFYPFDILRLGGVDLRDRPWSARSEALGELLADRAPEGCQVVTSGADGPAMWEATAAVGAEGVVAKRCDSTYRPGRSKLWLTMCSTRVGVIDVRDG